LRLYLGAECLQRGTGRVEWGPASEGTGYWMVLGSVTAPAGAALRGMLAHVQPQANPAGLAALLASVLFRESAVIYDYVVVPIPNMPRSP
jgi:hypothetical protein